MTHHPTFFRHFLLSSPIHPSFFATVAASGGYMMACVADRVVASPFAFLGSIGVVAGLPNVHKLLEKNEVEYLLFTAGKFKRTVGVLTENTDEAKEKFQGWCFVMLHSYITTRGSW